MKFPRLFGQRRTQSVRIRSLQDLDGHYPWPDLGASFGSLARREVKNPLAVAVRVLRVVEYTVATVTELNPNDRDADGMALLGLSGALHTLAQHGEWDAVGTLLGALEALMSPCDRPGWLAGLDPYKEPGEAPREGASEHSDAAEKEHRDCAVR